MADQFGRELTSDGLQSGGNIFLGLLAGVVAAAVGAGVWMGVYIAFSQTGIIPIGFMAIGLGALVGFAVRIAGRGRSAIFGIIGAVFSFLGCLGGEILTVVQGATSPESGFLDVLKAQDMTQLVPLIFEKMDVMTYIGFAIAVYEGYKFAMRR